MKNFIFVFFIVIAFSVNAQVGFNNPNPDASSLLDLKANDKGLLIPRMTSAQRDAIGSPAPSLLVYDTDKLGFYFYRGGVWYSLNEWVKNANSNDVSLTGNASVTGTVSTTNLNVSGFSTNALVPTGAIIMWTGTVAPTGWAICDGSNGTPDLRDRFIVGAGNQYGLGSSAGNKTISVQVTNLPSHSHTGTTSTVGNHNHSYSDDFAFIDQFWNVPYPGSYLENHQALGNKSGMGAIDNGSNTFAGRNKTTGDSGSHAHTFTTDPAGNSQPIDVTPPYYALAYIKKL